MGRKGQTSIVIRLDEAERKEFVRCSNSHTAATRDALRANIILLKSEGKTQQQVSDGLGIARRTVMKWTDRFIENHMEGLFDAPGRGRKPTIPEEINSQIITKATQPPENMSRWSTRTMARELGVSNYHVSKIWRANGIKPHLVRTFKLSRDTNVEQKFWDGIGLYLDPPEQAIVFCCDEKSQWQAIERSQPGLPLGRGHIRTRTHDYYRHGTTTLFAALSYLDGSIISMTEKRHRHEEWLKFLSQIDSEVPGDMDLHLIADTYSSHRHTEVQNWLRDHPRFHMHFIPTGSSWMNMVERFFADITADVMRAGSFQSLKELEDAIRDYMTARNRSPKRYVWKAEGRKILEKINRARHKLGWNPYGESISNSGD